MKYKRLIYSQNPLELRQTPSFAEGGNRLCFVHPHDNNLCIKVTKPDAIARLRAKKSFLKKLKPASYFDDNLNEYNAYQQPAIQNGGADIYTHIPHCYGWQETDLGAGLVSDYYSDDDQAPCKTLRQILQAHGYSDEIETKLHQLADYLRDTQLLTKNILPHNVVLAADGRLKIIDGIGAPSAFNIARFSKIARRHYIERRIARMFLRMAWEVSDKSRTWEATEKSGAI